MLEMLIAYQKAPQRVKRVPIDCARVQTVIEKAIADKSKPNKLNSIATELNAMDSNPDWSVMQIGGKNVKFTKIDSFHEDRICQFDDWLVWRSIYRICSNFRRFCKKKFRKNFYFSNSRHS